MRQHFNDPQLKAMVTRKFSASKQQGKESYPVIDIWTNLQRSHATSAGVDVVIGA